MAEAAARSLEFTPTWAVATVTTVFVVISCLVVYGIEKIEEWLKSLHRKPLVQALEKMKEELMLLGFISLLLTVFQNNVASICISTSTLDSWTPCHQREVIGKSEGSPTGRRLLTGETWPMMEWSTEPIFNNPRRILATGVAKTCKEGTEPFVSKDGLHQLHIFIFILACVHIGYSLIAMLLSSIKVNGWRKWEDEAQASSHATVTEMARTLTLNRQSTFVEYHTSKVWSRNRLAVWIVCFFRQFGQSVTRADYLTLRQGFITNHNTGPKFDFHKYMIRSMEDEFRRVVGISWSLWFFVVLFLLFNLNGSNLYFWLSFVPVVLVLLVGTKLHHIIATLALENAGITQGGHFAGQALKPRDELFWFSTPKLVLWCIHFILFENAFELSTFLWFRWQFGEKTCLLQNKLFVYVRLAMGVVVQILCSYSTLPLYAIVTQMGSHYKQAIFESHVKDQLHKWRKGAQKRAKLGTVSEERSTVHDISTRTEDDDSYMGNNSSMGNSHSTRTESEPTLEPVAPEDVPMSALELSRGRFGSASSVESLGPEESLNSGSARNLEEPKQSYQQVSTPSSREPDSWMRPIAPGGRSKSFAFGHQ